MEVAVVGVRGGARGRSDVHAHALRGQAPHALLDLAPLVLVACDLVRPVPAHLAGDVVLGDELAHESLRAPRQAPYADRVRLAVPTPASDGVLRDARKEAS